jgi:hypothetical protein
MFGGYGYDYFTIPSDLNYDESFYTETIKPLKQKENFDNEINNILLDDDELDPTKRNYMNKFYLNKILSDKQSLLENISNKCEYYKKLSYHKYKEAADLKNQMFVFYILLFISIIIIIYQKMSLNNMKNILYILEIGLQKKMTDEKKLI